MGVPGGIYFVRLGWYCSSRSAPKKVRRAARIVLLGCQLMALAVSSRLPNPGSVRNCLRVHFQRNAPIDMDNCQKSKNRPTSFVAISSRCSKVVRAMRLGKIEPDARGYSMIISTSPQSLIFFSSSGTFRFESAHRNLPHQQFST